MLAQVTDWIAAYWIHAAILHLFALGIVQAGRLPLIARERVWKLALVLPILSATAAGLLPAALSAPTTASVLADIERPTARRVSVNAEVGKDGAITSRVTVNPVNDVPANWW